MSITTTIPATKQKHYVNNETFLEEMTKFRAAVKIAKAENGPRPRVPEYIGECLFKIATHLARKPNFANYTFKEDMVSDGIENCLLYIDNFDPEKSKNPFAYFTQVIYFAFLRRIQKEKKQLYVKYKATEMYGILDEFEMLESEDGSSKQFELYDNIAEFIETYEDARKTKKAENRRTLPGDCQQSGTSWGSDPQEARDD